ncbi:MAG: anthranilate phosphoribosyltransferase [Deltaproteobacteria bacterium]|nr:anthranilate phosphoribosyltransferase [Deltaproteobacteria bacterium]
MQTPQDFIKHVAGGNNLGRDQAALAMEGIMTGDWSPAQIGAYLTALHMKGETQDEITGSAYVMRAKAFHLEVKNRPLVDIVGSGGDSLRTLNVSTLAALVCAGAGLRIAKHGNRAMTGMCGSADILEGLGVNLDISPADAIHGVDENGFTFLFAPHFHQSMKHAIGPRKDIGVPSIFNYLGPLTNPLAAEFYLMGVNRRQNTELFTNVLVGLGCQRSLLVHGSDGMDEITLSGPTHVVEQNKGDISTYEIRPQDFGMEPVPLAELTLPDKETSIATARSVIKGQGPAHQENMVVLNAGAAIYVGGKADSIAAGVEMARETLKSGAALKVLEKVAAYTASRKTQAG